jgi:outer membrane protein TolC
MNRSVAQVLSGSLFFWVFPSLAFAQSAPAAPAAPPAASAPGSAAPAAAATPTTPSAGAAHEGRGQAIDARTAVARAVAHNPLFQSNRLSLLQANSDLRAEEGRYPYVFAAEAGYTLSDGTATDASRRTYDASAAVRRTFPFGTNAEVSLTTSRNDGSGTTTDPRTGALTQYESLGYSAHARLTVTHPLLRGAGRDVGELGLRIARENRSLSQKTKVRALSELTRDVLLAYYQLWLADESVRIDESALELAQRQEREAQEKQQFGGLAPADVYSFSTRVASLQDQLVAARRDRRRQSFELARLMGVSATSTPELYAADPPQPGVSPSAAAVEAALRADSLELAEAEAQVRLARTRAGVAGDSGRPRLDLQGYLQSGGASDDPGVALAGVPRLDQYIVHVGATFELPLENTQKNAERESAILAVRIAEQSLKATRDRIASDAAGAVEQARAAEERTALSQRTVQIAEKSYEAARARYELGGGIAIEVQQAEEDLRQARLSAARTRAELVAAQIAMQHLAGTLAKAEPPKS